MIPPPIIIFFSFLTVFFRLFFCSCVRAFPLPRASPFTQGGFWRVGTVGSGNIASPVFFPSIVPETFFLSPCFLRVVLYRRLGCECSDVPRCVFEGLFFPPLHQALAVPKEMVFLLFFFFPFCRRRTHIFPYPSRPPVDS